MIFGIPREIRANEMRVGALPFLVKELTKRNHQVYVETGAGEYCEALDSHYEQVGATVVPSAEKLYSLSEIILKVREPKPVEFDLIRPDQAVFAFFHFLNNFDLIKALAERGCTCLAYEFVEDELHRHSLRLPISRITGQLAVINGAFYLQKHNGGRGVLLGSVSASKPAHVTILGAGSVGRQAALTAATMGARVYILDRNYLKLQNLDELGYHNITTLMSTDDNLRSLLPETDLLISCVQVTDQPTPKLISREMVKTMREGSVIVDVDVDMGGSVETSKVTTHDNPTFVVDGVVHYCVSNITSSVPLVASQALSASLLPYLVEIAEKGLEAAILTDSALFRGIAIYKGHIVKPYLSEVSGLPVADLRKKIQELTPAE